MTVQIIGAGLAGCEAAWQAARLGADVILYEMKPAKMTPAHSYKGFAELVCSNSLRSADIASGVGLLKEELSRMDSLIMEAAKTNAVPAGWQWTGPLSLIILQKKSARILGFGLSRRKSCKSQLTESL